MKRGGVEECNIDELEEKEWKKWDEEDRVVEELNDEEGQRVLRKRGESEANGRRNESEREDINAQSLC
jgi:hypothetical protein